MRHLPKISTEKQFAKLARMIGISNLFKLEKFLASESLPYANAFSTELEFIKA